MKPLPVALPDLQRRARLLFALHPALAKEARQLEFVPEAMVAWLGRLAGLPGGASFAVLIESLRADQPELASALEVEATQDRGLLTELDIDEARREVDGALNQMRSQQIREEVDRLAQQGLDGEAERARYTELQALRKTLTSTEGA